MTINEFRAKIAKQRLLGCDVTLSALRLLYMEHKNMTSVEDLDAEVARLKRKYKLDGVTELFKAVRYNGGKYYRVDVIYLIRNDMNFEYPSKSKDFKYSLDGIVYVDETLALFIVSDLDFAKLVLNQYPSNCIDYFNDEDFDIAQKLMKNSDNKLYISGCMQNDIFLEVDSSNLIINSRLKIPFDNFPTIIKWMCLQLQLGSVFASDIVYTDGALVTYLAENFTQDFLKAINYGTKEYARLEDEYGVDF